MPALHVAPAAGARPPLGLVQVAGDGRELNAVAAHNGDELNGVRLWLFAGVSERKCYNFAGRGAMRLHAQDDGSGINFVNTMGIRSDAAQILLGVLIGSDDCLTVIMVQRLLLLLHLLRKLAEALAWSGLRVLLAVPRLVFRFDQLLLFIHALEVAQLGEFLGGIGNPEFEDVLLVVGKGWRRKVGDGKGRHGVRVAAV